MKEANKKWLVFCGGKIVAEREGREERSERREEETVQQAEII